MAAKVPIKVVSALPNRSSSPSSPRSSAGSRTAVSTAPMSW
jgi:hypothetical protein